MDIRQFEPRHIQHFLDLLDEHRKAFFEQPPELRPQRLYFVDSDVLSVYINGKVRSSVSGWASLFSLDGQEHGHFVAAPEAEGLSQAVGQAVTRFLFGQFNIQLSAQQRRYYLTAEHERELRGIVSSILHHAKSLDEVWQDRLQAEYLKFCGEALKPEDAQKSAEKIMYSLVEQSPLGRVPRAYAIDRDFTSRLSSNLIRPPVSDGASFIFSEDEERYTEILTRLKKVFFEVYLQDLGRRHAGAERYFPIKRKVFGMHGADIPLKRYVDAVCGDEIFRAQWSREELEAKTLIAAREANDVVSLARLAALSDYLNNRHSMQGGRQWEACLISGSSKLRDLLSALDGTEWKNLIQNRVRLVHPLCFLRHPELYDPDGVNALERRGEGEFQDQEYALTQIFGNAGEERRDVGHGDTREFVQSLTRTLHGIVAREARKNDRSLRSFWGGLELDAAYNQDALMANVRSYIAYRFTDTLFKLTELVPGEKDTLRHVSVPTLDLRQSSAALTLLKAIRDSVGDDKREKNDSLFSRFFNRPHKLSQSEASLPKDEFKKVLSDDPTGYSAMLCAAMVYIVRGKSGLQFSRVMTSTAVMFALGSRDEYSYPQGNEALYLRAFLSRIMFDPSNVSGLRGGDEGPSYQLDHWLDTQINTLGMARSALDRWRVTEHLGADEPVLNLEKNRYELMRFRYDIEELASRFFAMQWKYLLGKEQIHESLQTSVPSMLDLVDILEKACAYLEGEYRAYDKLNESCQGSNLQENHYLQTVTFIGSQLWAVILQSWLSIRFKMRDGRVAVAQIENAGLDGRIRNLEDIISTYLPPYHQVMKERMGQVVRLTMETYAIARLGIKQGGWGINRKCFNEVYFAAIDDLRFRFFEHCWDEASMLQTDEGASPPGVP